VPIYEYVCESCGKKFEKLVRSMSSSESPACPKCGKTQTRREFSAFAVGASQGGNAAAHGAGCGCCGARSTCPNAQ